MSDLLRCCSLLLLTGVMLLASPIPGCGDSDPETGATDPVATATDGSETTDGSEATDGGDDTDSTTGGLGPLADLCTACEVDADCGAGGACVDDARGTKFCSRPCGYFGDNACDSETYYCKQLGTNTTDFYCWPLDGVCENDGLDCAPCRPDTDNCADGLFCFEPTGNIGFCVRECEGTGTCPYPNMECGHHEKIEGSICLPVIDGKTEAKCGARPRAFCEPCTTTGSCSTGMCVDSDNVGQVCSMPCDSKTDCPSGTFCVQGACLPPLGYTCQAWLSCQGVECQENEICLKGYCLPAP